MGSVPKSAILECDDNRSMGNYYKDIAIYEWKLILILPSYRRNLRNIISDLQLNFHVIDLVIFQFISF